MFQFPANPTIGQQFSPAQGVTYEWNGTGWLYLGLNTASLYPPGIILPYAGAAPLPFQGWLVCDGASYAASAYPALFAIIAYTYGGSAGSFNVPDLRGRVVAGVDGGAGRLTPGTLGAALGAARVSLSASEMATHSHGITDVAHGHGVSDPTHAHAIYDPGHSHGVNDPGHSHGVSDPGHWHAYQRAISQGNMKPASSGTAPFDTYDSQATDTRGTGISIAGSGTGVYLSGAGTSIGIYGAYSGISIQGNGTGITGTNAAGGGEGHLNVQPTLHLNYIIKAG